MASSPDVCPECGHPYTFRSTEQRLAALMVEEWIGSYEAVHSPSYSDYWYIHGVG